jgi:hypothetical protein
MGVRGYSTAASVGATVVASTAYEASHVLKSTPGTLLMLSGYNSKGSAQFIQLHDAAALPADNAVPVFVMTVATVANFTVTLPIAGLKFATGIVVCNSSTGPTKTIGTTDCWFTAEIV